MRSAPGAYKCGAVYGIRIEVAGITLYHQGSADLDDAELQHEPVDVFLAGVTGRQVTPHYWERILPQARPAGARADALRRLLRAARQAAEAVRKVDLEAVPDEVRAVSSDATVAALRRVD